MAWSSRFPKSDFIIDAVVAVFVSMLLFGGGFALEKRSEVSGLTLWFASKIDLFSGDSTLIVILAACIITLLMTQLLANVTVVQALLPLCVAFSISLKINLLFLMLPITFCASAAFMLPISTPPNTILFATNQIKMKEMLLPGLLLVVISGLVITIGMYFWGSYVFGIKP